MELSSTSVLSVNIFCLIFFTIPFVTSQPTVQNGFWRSNPTTSRCSNKGPQFRSRGENHLKVSSGTSDLQASLDIVLLEMQKHRLDTAALQRDIGDLKQHHEENRKLLTQLTESMNILVKRLVKNAACSCDQSTSSSAPDGSGRDGRERAGDPSHNLKDDSLNGYVKIVDSLPGGSVEGAGGAEEQVFMDGKEAATSAPQQRSEDVPGHLAEDTSRDVVLYHSQDEEPSASETTRRGRTTTAGTTTATLDPIFRMYNGSLPKDCDDIKILGYSRNGTYRIKPASTERSIPVLCEFHLQDVWTLIQRRMDGSQDFYRTWNEYKRGFGDLKGEFWIGNEILHQLTNQDYYRLKIDMWEWPRLFSKGKDPMSRYYFAESRYFFVDNETDRYELHVPQDYFAYTGFAGSGLRIHAGPFLTKDVARLPEGMRENCAQKFHCGWWFTTCVRNANFNGRYYKGGYANLTTKRRAQDDIYWPNIDQSLYRVVMKVGRVNESYAFRTYL